VLCWIPARAMRVKKRVKSESNDSAHRISASDTIRPKPPSRTGAASYLDSRVGQIAKIRFGTAGRTNYLAMTIDERNGFASVLERTQNCAYGKPGRKLDQA
jgi:hypothetical protein